METVLYSFCHDFGCSDGASPSSNLIADNAGNLYGTTDMGGPSGSGTVFKLSLRGAYTVLHSFSGATGSGSVAGLTADSAGNLYGTTKFGGPPPPGCRPFCFGYGLVFKLSPSGAYTVLHSFTGGSDGSAPNGLIADSAGNLYGTTEIGGHGGTVFKLSPPANPGGAWTETVLYSFCSKPGCSGGSPRAALIADSAGNLYGTTSQGGGASGCGGNTCGTVFKLSPGGAYTVLHTFSGSDGANPQAGLIADCKGNLYGTTASGGAFFRGTAFELTGTGFVTTIPFSAFSSQLEIDLDPKPADDAFLLLSEFTLGPGSAGINPPAEPVILRVSAFTAALPAGSFKGSGSGPFTFQGVINGVDLQVVIEPAGAKRYSFAAAGHGANLTGTKNPATVTLTIGNDTGTASVNAQIGP
jgi:uncharacterized repeat protein (TIGR03803 family)